MSCDEVSFAVEGCSLSSSYLDQLFRKLKTFPLCVLYRTLFGYFPQPAESHFSKLAI